MQPSKRFYLPHHFHSKNGKCNKKFTFLNSLTHSALKMASCLLHPPTIFTFSHKNTHYKLSHNQITPLFTNKNQVQFFPNSSLTCKPSTHLGFCLTPQRATSNGFLDNSIEENETLPLVKEEHPVKYLLWVFIWASVSVAWFAFSGDAEAAVDSIKASSFGLKFANFLRGSGWPDEAVVFALATLPVIELRGAIPVGYWLQLKPILLTALSVLGNMVPVPFIILYLKPLAKFLAGTNKSASRFLEILFEKAKQKAGPVEEFQWLGLMLFVAVPFPGTGAWTGAIIASILDMPFWPAVSANFFGVMLAGLLINLLVNLGLKYAIVACIILFTISTFMWSILRSLKRCLSS